MFVWWNVEVVIYFELVQNDRTIDADLHCVKLDRMCTALTEKYPALVHRNRVLLQQDNGKRRSLWFTLMVSADTVRETKNPKLIRI